LASELSFQMYLHLPFPGCCGDEVANTEYNAETALADISGVSETEEVVVAAEPWEDKGSCEVAILKKQHSHKLKRRAALMSMTSNWLCETLTRQQSTVQ
jgi:hypothetical protein